MIYQDFIINESEYQKKIKKHVDIGVMTCYTSPSQQRTERIVQTTDTIQITSLLIKKKEFEKNVDRHRKM